MFRCQQQVWMPSLRSRHQNEPECWWREWQHWSLLLLHTRTLTHGQPWRQHGPLCPLTMSICLYVDGSLRAWSPSLSARRWWVQLKYGRDGWVGEPQRDEFGEITAGSVRTYDRYVTSVLISHHRQIHYWALGTTLSLRSCHSKRFKHQEGVLTHETTDWYCALDVEMFPRNGG